MLIPVAVLMLWEDLLSRAWLQRHCKGWQEMLACIQCYRPPGVHWLSQAPNSCRKMSAAVSCGMSNNARQGLHEQGLVLCHHICRLDEICDAAYELHGPCPNKLIQQPSYFSKLPSPVHKSTMPQQECNMCHDLTNTMVCRDQLWMTCDAMPKLMSQIQMWRSAFL